MEHALGVKVTETPVLRRVGLAFPKQAPSLAQSVSAPSHGIYLWRRLVRGSVNQFLDQTAYLAGRNMVAMLADHRVKSLHQVTPFECITDGESAVRGRARTLTNWVLILGASLLSGGRREGT
jgi:hypothetical protein